MPQKIKIMSILNKGFVYLDQIVKHSNISKKICLECLDELVKDNIVYHFELLKLNFSYSMGYKGIVDENDGDYNMIDYHILLWNKNLLTCAYEMLCWLAENEYLKGGEK